MKDEEPIATIYCIENNKDGKKYIGKTVHYDKRIREHKNSLIRGNHSNQHLQNAWNKYGDIFSFYLLEECSNSISSEREVFYIKYYKSKVPNGYNFTDGGEGSLGYKASDDTRRLLSKIRTGRKLSNIHRLAIAKGKLGDKNPNYKGKATTEESKRKQSEALSGRKRPKHRRLLQGRKRKDSHNYVGVYERKKVTRVSWVARITFKGESIELGSFGTEEEAARVYDKKALELYGKTARLNFPENKDENNDKNCRTNL